MIAAQQIFLGRGGGAKLPYDAEVEYLESTGTQYIDTGINPQSSTTWSTDIVCLPNSGITYMSLIGYYYTSLGVQSVGITNQKWSQTSLSVDYANQTLVHADQIGQSFNGIQGNSNNIGKGLLYLFNRTSLLNQYPWKGKIYSAKIWVESILVRDFIPVRFTNELGQSEGAMYDKVSGQLFRNQGTGAFLYGGDIYSVPVETSQYVQDGLVAMWDGKENAGVGLHDPNATVWKDLTRRSPDINITSDEISWSNNACVRVGTGGKTIAYPNIDLSNPLSERTIEFVVSALNLPLTTTTAYYFSSMPTGGGSMRITWEGSTPHLFYTLRSSGGKVDSGVGLETLENPASISLVGTGSQSSETRNYAYYYTNGIEIGRGLFGGDPIAAPALSLFQDVRNWPSVNTIRFHAIRFYSRALTAEEIAANYAVDKQRFNLP